MANIYTPDRAAEAAISKDSILLQLTSKFRQAKRCIPVLWKRLVLPVLLAKMEQKPLPHVDCSEQTLDIDLQTVIIDVSERRSAIQLLTRYDYIRRRPDGRYAAGTRLWTEVHASRMMQALKFCREHTD